MRFLLDESADFRLGRYLAALGHDVTAISRDYPQSLADFDVLALANAEQRILITRDRDFGELIFRQHQRHSGVILFRLGPGDYMTAVRRLDEIIENYHPDLRHFLVVTRRGIRTRGILSD
jgi:predicted nuclease of predicted toxin-antitoxin system